MRYGKIESAAAVVAMVLLAAMSAVVPAAELRTARNPIEGQYIVVLKEGAASLAGERNAHVARVPAAAREMAAAHKATLLRSYEHALRGFAVRADDGALAKLIADPRVAYVEEDARFVGVGVQTGATWGLDRIDQRAAALNGVYASDYSGYGVHAYVVDSGLRAGHTQFAGRVGNGADFAGDGRGSNDCHGHGTHVAGTLAGTDWGVAKRVIVHPVRVLDCFNSGSASTVIAGVDWVLANHIKPAVANMSVGGSATATVDAAVAALIDSGVVVVVAAGNSDEDACEFSPGRVRKALTVGSIDRSGARSEFSNYGICLDLFAPGRDVTSAGIASDTASAVRSGTSMASPHAAGVAALFLQQFPGAKPSEVIDAIVGKAVIGAVADPGPWSPNHLLHSRLSIWPRIALFRYYDVAANSHFYTRQWSVLSAAGVGDWSYQGVTGYVRAAPAAGTRAFHRYFNASQGRHYFTTNFDELGNGRNGWVYGGVAAHLPIAAAADTANLHRYYNTATNRVYYTANFAELGGGGTRGWVYQGVVSQIWTRH